MTKAQLASFITTKLSLTDSASVSFCKDAIDRRYQMLWDSALWTETLGISTKAVSAGDTTVTLDGAPSITFYQSGSAPTTFIDFAVAVKFTETGEDDGVEGFVADWMSFFQIDPNEWVDVTSRRSNPRGYIPLPKDASGYFRLKPVPVPASSGTLYVLGKLKWVALADSDSACLRGADNALIAFVEGDMLERARQYGKAQAKYAEAAAAVQIMRDVERGQQTVISRIIPMDEGYDQICPPE